MNNNEQYKIKEQYTELFYLKDPLKSFEPSNREIFKVFSYGPAGEEESDDDSANPCGLKKWFLDNPEKTFYEIQEENNEENKKLLGDNLQRNDLINYDINDQQMIDFVCKQFDDAEKQFNRNFLDIFDKEDPDCNYILQNVKLINKNYQERHQIEKELPMMYEQRKTRKSLGCIHTLTNCLLWCDQCQKYYICPRCHDEQIFEHQLKYKNIQKCKCLKCNTEQNVGEKCINCGTIFASNWCDKCRILRIVDNQSTPVFHCQKHDECHYNTHPYHCFCCDTCKSCFPNDNKKYHDCNGTFCCVCQGQIPKEDDIVFCTASNNHAFHSYCFDQLCSQAQGLQVRCPVCNTLLYDHTTMKAQQLRNLQSIRCHYGLKIFFEGQKFLGLYQQECKNCHQNTISTCGGVCPVCYYKCWSNIHMFYFDQIQQYCQYQIKYDQIDRTSSQTEQQFEDLRNRLNQQKGLYKSARILLGLEKGNTFYYTDRVLAQLTTKKDESQQNIDRIIKQLPQLETQIDQDDILEFMIQNQDIDPRMLERILNNIEEEQWEEEYEE